MMMKAKISEIFQSIQGEGPYVGIKQVFVRFYECNMQCVWCDTPNSIGHIPSHFDEFHAQELFQKVEDLWQNCHSVSLTGGEPMVQNDFLKEFLPFLKKAGKTVYLETNGILPDALKEIVDDVDIIAMDMKLPSSTKCQPYWREHEDFLKVALKSDVFIKVVISGDTVQEEVLQAARLVALLDKDLDFILQPNHFEIKNGALQKCFAFQGECGKYLSRVRVIPQVHKFMKLR